MSPELLVSVRNATEAEDALAGGADWIDVKEPAAGSLGRPSACALAEVVEVVAKRAPVSVALGELRELGMRDEVAKLPLAGVDRVKVGLSGCRTHGGWQEELSRLITVLPSHASMVAVQYADWRTCDAPSPRELVDFARVVPCAAMLIDTFDKRSGKLFDWIGDEELAELFGRAHDLGLTCVAAGSLTTAQFERTARAGADVLAVRGAACEQNVRTSAITRHQVRELRDFLSHRFAKIS
ncbi:(5-formylfuran-3-yl)methyl phosphate synthase [Aeoliella sp. SH292]|uniref:(5-formylfuran-3-yl)methyl phosphate synthase n=1 Tax=Aeoliella sp. SH292 TaxID=3454464 RepID=UPI003F962451